MASKMWESICKGLEAERDLNRSRIEGRKKNKKYTKAEIDQDTLFWLFGVELGCIDCSIHSLDALADYVDKHYTKQQIIDLTLNPSI